MRRRILLAIPLIARLEAPESMTPNQCFPYSMRACTAAMLAS